jgi:hypothetical protein
MYRIYYTILVGNELKVKKSTETDLQPVADEAFNSWVGRLGPTLVVVELTDGEITRIARGTK